ncbi:hypothetical protein ANCDUO_10407, partial [Ancylostoma duodenale]
MLEQSRMDVRFHLEGTPYVADDTIGTGAYGVVCKAKHLAIVKSDYARQQAGIKCDSTGDKEKKDFKK